MSGRGEFSPTGFGQRLREVREAKGLTQKGLADAASTHVNTVARLERGEHEPAWPLVLALAKALGVDCTAFAGTGAQGDGAEAPKEQVAEKPALPPAAPASRAAESKKRGGGSKSDSM